MRQAVSYLDGIGRTIQTIATQGAPTKQDIVSYTIPDPLNRNTKQYLPYVSGNDGNYQSSPTAAQSAFYQTVKGDNLAFAESRFETSPLSRVLEQGAPGASWQIGSDKTKKIAYTKNGINDIRIWSYDPINKTAVSSGFYTEGVLYVVQQKDEQGAKTLEYKNKSGLVICKKAQKIIGDEASYLLTYYLYDDFGNLSCILTPKAIEQAAINNWQLAASILNELCFQFVYDEQDRMIMQKAPGAGEEYRVYDIRDRLVFTQHANLRSESKWQTTLYDAFDRAVMTGITSYTGTATSLQQTVTQKTTTLPPPPSGTPTDLVLTTVSSGIKQAINSITMTDGFESASGTEFIAEIHPNVVSRNGEITTIEGLAVHKSPIPDGATFALLTQTYYDNYEWLDTYTGHGFTAALSTQDQIHFLPASTTAFPYAESIVQSNAVRGQITGTRTRVLGSNQDLYSIHFYDEKARLIQLQAQHINNGKAYVTTQYSYTGQVLQTILRQEKGGTGAETHLVLTKNYYDEGARVLKTEKKLTSTIKGIVMSTDWKTIAAIEYDVLGNAVKKHLGTHPDNSQQPLETLTYDHNIRGWLLGVNRNYIKGTTTQKFGYELGYDNSTPALSTQSYTPQYNGNISGVIWKSAGDEQARRYDFSYDGLNQLTKADFNQYTDGGFNKNAGLDFSVGGNSATGGTLKYDANGNLLELWQKGWKITGSDYIDQLTYNYFDNSNKLKNVVDTKTDKTTKLGDFHYSPLYEQTVSTDKPATTIDYGYDLAGNMVTDLNKDIRGTIGQEISSGAIVYNYLHLPQTIPFYSTASAQKGTISYTYDATGNKLKKVVIETLQTPAYTGQLTTTTTYMGGFVYKSRQYEPAHPDQVRYADYTDQLQLMLHEEGRVRYEPANPANCSQPNAHLVYDYFLRDHLGNVRMVLTEGKESVCYIGATVEASRLADEKKVYEITDSRIRPVSEADASSIASFENQVYRTHGSLNGEKTGLGIVLKVMSGDKVRIRAESFYTLPGSGAGGPANIALEELLAAFAGSNAVSVVKGGVSATDVQNVGTNATKLTNFLNRTPADNQAKAYLNWILFDEQLKFVSSGADPVGAGSGNIYKLHDLYINSPVTATKNGYLYVFVSNESNLPVYFDNLSVTHIGGTILEESHYYPMGMEIAALSSRALRDPYALNTLKYQGQEYEGALGLNMHEFEARQYDPQLGRWVVPDPAHQFHSPYMAMGNNPVIMYDPDGRLAWFVPIIVGAAIGAFTGGIQADMQGKSFGSGAWKGAIVGGVGGAMGVGLAGSFSNMGMVGGGMMNGAITGFTTGGLNAALNGTDIGKGAIAGMLSGALVGGATGTIKRLGIRNSEFQAGDLEEITGEVFESNEELRSYINNNIGDVNKIEATLNTNISVGAQGNLPPGYTLRGNMIYNRSGESVLGVTHSKGGWFNGLDSKVYITPGTKGTFYSGVNASKMVINHELIHAYHAHKNFFGYNMFSERATSQYTFTYAKAYKIEYWMFLRNQIAPVPKYYSWRNLIGILDLGIK